MHGMLRLLILSQYYEVKLSKVPLYKADWWLGAELDPGRAIEAACLGTFQKCILCIHRLFKFIVCCRYAGWDAQLTFLAGQI